MKYIFILLGLVSFAFAQEKFKLPDAISAKINKFSADCAQEFGVDPGILVKFADGTLERNETYFKYIYCTTTKTGFVDETGHVDVNKVARLLGDHPLLDKFTEAFNKCNELNNPDPVITVGEIGLCYGKTSPIHFIV